MSVWLTSCVNKIRMMLLAWISLALFLPAYALADSAPQNNSAQIQKLIDKIHTSVRHTSFTGKFLHKQGELEQLMEVSRLCEKNGHKERIVAIGGRPSEIVRIQDKVWYYDPNMEQAIESSAIDEHAGLVGLQLSEKLQRNYTYLKDYYQFVLGEMGVIAGKKARQLKIISKDKWRFGYHLWMDENSGLILRTDMYDENWELIETFVFKEIEIGTDIPEEKFEPSEKLRKLVKREKVNTAPTEVSIQASKWRFEALPPGFMVKQRLLREEEQEQQPMEQFLIGDGLSMVSVMIMKSQMKTQKSASMQWGTMNVFSRYDQGYKISALGEAPAQTLQEIAENIKLK